MVQTGTYNFKKKKRNLLAKQILKIEENLMEEAERYEYEARYGLLFLIQ